MSLLSGLVPASDLKELAQAGMQLAERAVSALERVADELHAANEARDLELNGPRDYR